jgi:DNA repair exonuclease SbcCD ATPase subunit
MEKIRSLRQRFIRVSNSIEHYEARVEEQEAKLKRLNRPRDPDADALEDDDDVAYEYQVQSIQDNFMSQEDVKRAEQEIRELERKRQILEERVNALGRDITGVLR